MTSPAMPHSVQGVAGNRARTATHRGEGSDTANLRDAIDGLERARELRELPPPYQAALARCYFAAKRPFDAAAQYELLVEKELPGAWSLLSSYVYRALADSYVAAEEPAKAIYVLQSCSSKFPRVTDIYLMTAKLQAEEADYQAVAETIRKATDNNPDFDEDWRWSTVLALAGVHPSPGEILKSTQVDPRSSEQIAAFLKDYWPPFEKLSGKAKEQWIKSAYLRFFLAQRDMAEIFTLEALQALVKALDMELAERVFQPVREHFRRDEQLYNLVKEELERGPIGG